MSEKYFGSDTDIEELKISDEDVDGVKISKLPNRPNSVSAFGGTALSAKDLKEKYDAPTQMIKDKFNALVDEINKIEGPASAEQNRRAAESLRAEAEESRIAEEAKRAEDEAARLGAEEDRKASETERVENESSRELAEQQRAQAEDERIANELARQAVMGDLDAALDGIIAIQEKLMGGSGV